MKPALLCCVALVSLNLVQGETTRTPVERVVQLLRDLLTNIENEHEVEEQSYNKFACWCDNALKGKADAIDQARTDIRKTGQEILRLKGLIATLEAEIAQLNKEIDAAEELIKEATTIREKENAAFNAETAEFMQVLVALEKAIPILYDATKPALVQSVAGAGSAAVQRVIAALPSRANVNEKQLSLLSEFTGFGTRAQYAPQSLTVQGILKDMYDSFSADLESATQKEATSWRDFETLVATTQEKLIEMRNMKKAKTEKKDEAAKHLAEAETLYHDTQETMDADIAFFDQTKKMCEDKHAEWTLRTEMRDEEIAGVKKALEILTSDDNRELFEEGIQAGKETNVNEKLDSGADIAHVASFLQVASDDSPAARAYLALKTQASKVRSLRLAQLAVQVHEAKVGHFDKVIGAIDEMIQTLRDEDAADIAKRDQCKEQFTQIESTVKDLEWKIKNNNAKIDRLQAEIEKKEEEKHQAERDIVAVRKEIVAANATRKDENAAFVRAKDVDNKSIAALVDARTALQAYYKNRSIDHGPIQAGVKDLHLVREPVFEIDQYDAPETTFTGKGAHHTHSKNIVSLMTYIIQDLEDEIKNGMTAEAAALESHESWVADAHKTIDGLEKKINEIEGIIADRTDEKSDEESELRSNEDLLKEEHTYHAGIKSDCDWIIGAFEERAAKRTAEMNGLTGAKDYLAGANEASLVQRRSTGFLASSK